MWPASLLDQRVPASPSTSWAKKVGTVEATSGTPNGSPIIMHDCFVCKRKDKNKVEEKEEDEGEAGQGR